MRHARVASLSALVVPALFALHVAPASATTPDPRFTTIDAVVVGNASGTPIGGTPPGFDVVTRDVTNAPLPGQLITLDFSNTGMKLYSAQNSGITLDCAAHTISRVTGEGGATNIAARLGGYVNTTAIGVYENGVLIGNVRGRSTDLDGLDGKTGLGDLALFSANFFNNPAAQETDFDLNGSTGLNDLRIFAEEYLRIAPAQAYCP